MQPKRKLKVFEGTADATGFLRHGSAVAIGNYDGVHYGHRCILKNLTEKARALKTLSVLLTFEPHPVKVLSPEVAPKLINTKKQKIELLAQTELDCVIFQTFSKSFARTKPETFFLNTIVKNLKARYLTVGYDFTFGNERSGTADTLETLATKHGIELKIVPAQMLNQTLVSSSVIRKIIKEGHIVMANKLLTRPFYIDGTVIRGFCRGTALGIHTANIKTENELMPPDGVYATLIHVNDNTYKSVTNIGFNPTFDNLERSIETHILDFEGDIYDQTVRLCFAKQLRQEIKFATPTALVKQIGIDIENTKNVLKDFGVK
ncbi:MAG: bifunctional riboflavin kinase/FAD synthetase [Deltaproteobacteria bacterium]|nr:bifunctional riboflavin kinase/FAD synthetase [Deltaproteobacteria bacterium]